MRIRLEDLEDNPFRDFDVDPISDAWVSKLIVSIHEHDYWGGITARKIGRRFQIAAGHHRVRAARLAGIKEAEIFVGEFDDDQMVAIYATENATQRGNEGAAQLGSVAAGILRIAQVLAQNHSFDARSGFMLAVFKTKAGFATARAHFLSETGVGEVSLNRFFKWKNVPDMGRSIIERQLVTLKASGDYARIIESVQAMMAKEAEEAESEEQEAEAEMDSAVRSSDPARKRTARTKLDKTTEKRVRKVTGKDTAATAAGTAKKQPIKFDLKRVRQHLEKQDLVDTFQDLVTSPGVLAILPVEKQAALAAHMVEQAKEDGVRMSSTYLHKHVFSMAEKVIAGERNHRREDVEKARRESMDKQLARAVLFFGKNVRGAHQAMRDMRDMNTSKGLVLDALSDRDQSNIEGWLTMLEEVLEMAQKVGLKPAPRAREERNVLDLQAVRRTRQPRIGYDKGNGEELRE